MAFFVELTISSCVPLPFLSQALQGPVEEVLPFVWLADPPSCLSNDGRALGSKLDNRKDDGRTSQKELSPFDSWHALLDSRTRRWQRQGPKARRQRADPARGPSRISAWRQARAGPEAEGRQAACQGGRSEQCSRPRGAREQLDGSGLDARNARRRHEWQGPPPARFLFARDRHWPAQSQQGRQEEEVMRKA